VSIFETADPGDEQPGRRHLSERQAEVMERLVAAASQEAEERPYGDISVRTIAKREGVAPATAYTYFASKDHLLAEVLWRRLDRLPAVETDPRISRSERVTRELCRLATFMADDPDLAAACTTALLGSGADVRALRDRFGNRILSRISAAFAEGADPRVVATLNLTLIGSMLSAGMGHLSFSAVPDAMANAVSLVIDDRR
jgi:AcrR family transcriptional regulator